VFLLEAEDMDTSSLVADMELAAVHRNTDTAPIEWWNGGSEP